MTKKKLIRTSTIALSLDVLLKGQLSYLNQYYNVVAVSGEDLHLETVRNREGVITIDVAMQRDISPLKDVISLIRLYKIFKKEKPFIVHSITPKAGLLSMVAAYFARVPVRIHTFTGLVFPSKKGILQKTLILMDKILCRFATHIYPEGQGVKNDLISYKITKKPLSIIANGNVNGIDTSYYDCSLFSENETKKLKAQLAIQETDFIFIFVGRLVSDKGINELIPSFEKLQNENNKVKLLLVGNFENQLDPLLPETLTIISDNKSIISVGYQNDVRPYFAIANCLVFPSYREGFPNVVLQAGAMNLPSIVTNINGCNEIIIEEKNGLIIPAKNEEAIFEAMKKIIEDEKLRNKLTQNSRSMITSRFEQKLVWEAILKEYRVFEM